MRQAGSARLNDRVRGMRARILEDRRLARLLHGSLSGILGRGLNLLLSLITLPLTVRYLGKLEYGIWVTISTSVAMLTVADLGIANTLTNLISEAYAADDREKAQRAFATAFWMTMGLLCVLAPICWFAWSRTDWARVFHLADPTLLARTRTCVGLIAAFGLTALPLNLGYRVLAGYQRVHLGNYLTMASTLLNLPVLLLIIAHKGTIVMLTAATTGIVFAPTAVLNLWLWLRHTPRMVPAPRKAHRATARRLLGEGFLFFIVQLTGLVVFYSDNIVITHYLGASEVTPYSVAYRLTSYAGLLQVLIAPSVWPALSEAYRKGDLAWVERTYRSVNRKTLTAIGCLAFFLALAGRSIIRLWIGPATVPSAHLLWLMAAFMLTMAATSNQALLLNASSRLRLEAAAAVLAAAANLALSIYLVQRIGVEGVILGSLMSFLVFMVVPQAWEVRRVLAGRYLARDVATPEPALGGG